MGYCTGTFGGNKDFQIAKLWYKRGSRLVGRSRLGTMHCSITMGLQRSQVTKEKVLKYSTSVQRKIFINLSFGWRSVSYLDGEGFVQSFEQARYWWEMSSEIENTSIENLSTWLLEGSIHTCTFSMLRHRLFENIPRHSKTPPGLLLLHHRTNDRND